jgi:two-component system response regulator FixJ
MCSTRLLIAVVDDDQSMPTATLRLLRAAGFDAATFPSGAEFLESLNTCQPDCVLLDLDVPQLDGFAVQARLAKAGIQLPVVTITGGNPDATRNRALAGGASAYLNKPVPAEMLLDAIAAATSQPPAPAGSADNLAVSRHHPNP